MKEINIRHKNIDIVWMGGLNIRRVGDIFPVCFYLRGFFLSSKNQAKMFRAFISAATPGCLLTALGSNFPSATYLPEVYLSV